MPDVDETNLFVFRIWQRLEKVWNVHADKRFILVFVSNA